MDAYQLVNWAIDNAAVVLGVGAGGTLAFYNVPRLYNYVKDKIPQLNIGVNTASDNRLDVCKALIVLVDHAEALKDPELKRVADDACKAYAEAAIRKAEYQGEVEVKDKPSSPEK